MKNHPDTHNITTDKALYEYVNELKTKYLKRAVLNKVAFDGKVSQVHNALGIHGIRKRVQGNKIKSKKEIKISNLFKKVPEEFLKMIVVHELAHFKEKVHDKAFYKLCAHMYPEYEQAEFHLRLYLLHLEVFGELY